QTGNIILTPPSNLLETSIRHYNEKYTDLRNKFATGAGETLIPDLENLLKDLEKFKEEDFRTLRCWIYLLLAEISLNRKPQDFVKASEYLEHAKTYENQQTAEFIFVINSLLYFYKGEMEEAANELESVLSNKLASKNVFRMQFLIAIETEKVGDVLLEQAMQKAKKDNIFLLYVAIYYTKQHEKNSAIDYITQYLESDKPDALAYMQAAGLMSQNAALEVKQICKKYNLFEKLSLFFKHNFLIDKKLILQAIELFEKAAEKYKELGETTLEREALESALRPFMHPDLKSDKEPQLIARLKEIAPQSQYAIMAEKKTRSEFADYTAEQFKEIIEVNAGDPNIIWLITDWGMATNRIREAIELFDIPQNTVESIADKVVRTFARILLLLFAKDHQGALQTAEELVVPAEYNYIPLLFQAYVHSGNASGYGKAETLIMQAKEIYKEHPEVLAFSCDYLIKRQNWQALEADAELLFKIAVTTQSISYYLEALHRQGKYLRGIEIIEEAEKRVSDLPENITLLAKARLLNNIHQIEEALRLFEKAKAQNIPLEPMDELILAQLYIHSHRLTDAKKSLEKQKELHPSPEVYILLSQIEAEQNPQKSFEILDQGRMKFPDHEELLSKYIMRGFETGHDDEAAPLLTEFTRRFPGSKLLRPYPID
ncbi:MAG: hypothetical protein JXA43_01710, partial [Candidatus Diapherotrites archaeon]|nr:hypothetical protein [Candidatus Diapherotrites archaeon]